MLSILDKSRTIPDWRDAPAVHKILAELGAVSGEDVGIGLRQAVLDASRRLAEIEAREAHQRATMADVTAAKATLAAAKEAVAQHEDHQARHADRAAASRTIAAEVIDAAQRETAQRVVERGTASAKRLIPLVRRVLDEVEALDDVSVLERAYFGDVLSQPRDPVGNQVMPMGCYLAPGHQLYITFSAGQGRDAVLYMRDWLRRMEERGFK